MKKIEMSKVLIALDYNPSARKVAEIGYMLAKKMNAEVFLMHVLLTPVFYSSTEYSPITGFINFGDLAEMKLDNYENINKAAQHFLNKTKDHLGDKNIKTVIGDGEFALTILQKAKEVAADIIVMGSHSRKWLDNIVMGSVTQEVLKKSTLPLFIIPVKNQ
ncbi:MAG: universal stress protein [Prolixibacteraceae bacterium]